MTPLERHAENLAASLRFYGERHTEGNVELIRSPVDLAVFNIALPLEPMKDRVEDFQDLLHTARDHFQASAAPWSLWVSDDFLPPRTARGLDRVLDDWRLERVADVPGMEADRLAPPRRALPAIAPRLVRTEQHRRDFASIISVCFNLPDNAADRLYLLRAEWPKHISCWVAYDFGRPVATTAVVHAAGLAGIYSVATLPEHRRRGIAEALMRHAVEHAHRERGAERLVLQSSPEGRSLYRNMGFRKVTRFRVYATH